jgi:hypothetical protein
MFSFLVSLEILSPYTAHFKQGMSCVPFSPCCAELLLCAAAGAAAAPVYTAYLPQTSLTYLDS